MVNEVVENLQILLLKFAKIVAFLLVLGVATSISQLIVPLYSLQITGRAIATGDIPTIVVLTVIAVVFVFLTYVIDNSRYKIVHKFSHLFLDFVEREIIQLSSQSQDIGDHNSFGKHTKNIENFISRNLMHLIDAPLSIILFVILFFIHPLLGFVSIALAISIMLFSLIAKISNQPLSDKASLYYSMHRNRQVTVEDNFYFLKSNGLMKMATADMIDNHHIGNKLITKLRISESSKNNFLKMIRTVSQIFIIGLSGFLVIKDEIHIGAIIASSIINSKGMIAAGEFIPAVYGFRKSKISYKYLLKKYNFPKLEHILEKDRTDTVFSFERIVYFYQGSRYPTIKDISFSLSSGEIVAFSGEASSGKTTLLRIVSGSLLASTGISKINYIPYAVINSISLGENVSFIPQAREQVLCGKTIKESMIGGDSSLGMKDIVEVCDYLQIGLSVSSLTQGYDTPISGCGKNLSHSLVRNLLFARALICKPKIVIVDDINPANQEEMLLFLRFIQRVKKMNSALLYTTYNKELLALANKIYLMSNGKFTL